MFHRRVIEALLVLVSFVAVGTFPGGDAHAQSKREIKKAKLIFQEAEDLAADKQYLESAAKYLAAYALFPASDFLFNAAEMYKYAEDREHAIEYYKRYLAEAPEGRGAEEARTSLEALQRKLDEEEHKKQEDIERANAAQTLVDEKREADLVVDNIASAETTAAGAEGGANLRIAGLVGLSVGVVLVGVGGYYAVDSGNISDKVSASPDFQPGLEQDGKDAERNAYIFSGVGAAAIVGGAILYFVVGKDSGESNSVSLLPTLRNNSVAASLIGTF